jgi:exodeoxyribonuclease VII small subunit
MATTPGEKLSEDSKEPLSDAPSFEHTLGRLEEIVRLLEEGKIGLDEALARYEEGVGLLRKAYELLEGAQRRISLLSGLDSEGNPILRPMEDAASFSQDLDGVGPAPQSRGVEKTSSRRARRQADPDSP